MNSKHRQENNFDSKQGQRTNTHAWSDNELYIADCVYCVNTNVKLRVHAVKLIQTHTNVHILFYPIKVGEGFGNVLYFLVI